MQSQPGWWRVWVDGTPVTPPISLESSHDRSSPVATSESWNGGLDSCNGLGYRFANIRWSPSSRKTWLPLTNGDLIQAPGYSVQRMPAADSPLRAAQP